MADGRHSSGTAPAPRAALLPDGFLAGVATAGYAVEGGVNGPGQPANDWHAWELVGRAEPSGRALDFWARPEEHLDRAAALGCSSFGFSVEWARVVPEPGVVDRAALSRYVAVAEGCTQRGMVPRVTLLHLTHPAWLGADLWLRPDAPERYADWVTLAAGALAPAVRHFVTVHGANTLALGAYVLGTLPPGRLLGLADAAVAVDYLLTAHVLGYAALHRARPDAVVTATTACSSVYEADRLFTDLLLWRSLGVGRAGIDEWVAERRRRHDSLLPSPGVAEDLLRAASARRAAYGARGRRAGRQAHRRVLDAVEDSPHERALDVVGIDWSDPVAAHRVGLPRRGADGRASGLVRAPWEVAPDPDGLARWLGIQHLLTPGLPLWVAEDGLCTRAVGGRDVGGRAVPRADGWDRPRYLAAQLGAVVEAVAAGVPVEGYWHRTLADGYEWGSSRPRYGLHAVERTPAGEVRWLPTDSLGHDAAGAYRRLLAGLRAGDRSVLGGA